STDRKLGQRGVEAGEIPGQECRIPVRGLWHQRGGERTQFLKVRQRCLSTRRQVQEDEKGGSAVNETDVHRSSGPHVLAQQYPGPFRCEEVRGQKRPLRLLRVVAC